MLFSHWSTENLLKSYWFKNSRFSNLHILETLGFWILKVFENSRFLKTCCFLIGQSKPAVFLLVEQNMWFPNRPIKNLLFFYWFIKKPAVFSLAHQKLAVFLLVEQNMWCPNWYILKLSILIVQRLALHQNGVEFRQKSIGAIRCSVATSYDDVRRRTV